MKYMILLCAVFLSSCGFVRTTSLVEYRQVVVEPVVNELVVVEDRPVDVTVTEFDYY